MTSIITLAEIALLSMGSFAVLRPMLRDDRMVDVVAPQTIHDETEVPSLTFDWRGFT